MSLDPESELLVSFVVMRSEDPHSLLRTLRVAVLASGRCYSKLLQAAGIAAIARIKCTSRWHVEAAEVLHVTVNEHVLITGK